MSTGRNPPWGPRNRQTWNVESITAQTIVVTSGSTFPTGTWTPTLVGAGTAGTQTYATQYGRYMVVGNWVLIEGTVTLSNKDAAMAGAATIGGLPFTVVNSGLNNGGVSLLAYDNVDITAGYAQLGLVAISNSSVLRILESGDNVGAQFVDSAAITNTTRLIFGGWYRAS